MSRFLEMSWTTQVAQGQTSKSPLVLLERNVYDHPHARLLWDRQFEEVLLGLGKSTEFGMSFCSQKNKNYSYRYVDDINMAGKNRRWFPRGRNRWNLWTSENQHHFLTTCILDALNVNVKRTNLFLINKEKSNMTWMGETSRKDRRMVLRHGRTCSKVRRKVLWTGKQKERTLVQSFNSMLGWAQIQKGRVGGGWRIVQCLLSHCLAMLVFGTNWKTWHSLAPKQICTSCHKMDSSLRQTVSSFDFLHSSHRWLQTVLSRGQYSSTLSTGFLSRLRFRWRPCRFKINIRRNLVYLRKSNVRSHKLDVQEANVSVSKFHGIRS